MISLIAHALLAVVTVVAIVRANPAIFRAVPGGPRLSPLEWALYGIGIASVAVGWFFNITFVVDNTDGWFNNPLWGDGSWAQYMKLMFDNPAASSAGADFSIANVLILPIVAVVWGRRQGINQPVLFFVVTLFASFTFGWAFFAAALERQRRLSLGQPVDPDALAQQERRDSRRTSAAAPGSDGAGRST